METAKTADDILNPENSLFSMNPSSAVFGSGGGTSVASETGDFAGNSTASVRRPTALAYNNQDLFNIIGEETGGTGSQDYYGEPVDLQSSLNELHHDKRKTFFGSDPYLSSTVSKAAKSDPAATPQSVSSSDSSGQTPSSTTTVGSAPGSIKSKPAPKKPGRKPKTTEPESKRKAQNRAAQRAFRERKEKHLKELEDKIAELESVAETANTENEFLKKQVSQLESELTRYKGGNVSSTLGRLSRNSTSSSSGSTTSPSSAINKDGKPFSFEFPFFNNATGSSRSSTSSHRRSDDSSASYLSPLSTNSSSTRYSPPAYGRNGAEEVDDPNKFCAQMSLACGTNDNPVPMLRGDLDAAIKQDSVAKGRSPGYIGGRSPLLARTGSGADALNATNSSSGSTPFSNVDSPAQGSTVHDTSALSPNFDLDFLNDLHDPIFDGESFTLPELPVSYNMFDPMENPLANSSFDSMSKAKPVSEQKAVKSTDFEDETVPSGNARLVKCSEAWDRICNHPKFNDIDIESLCFELRSKAKCSDTGVLLNEKDIDKALESIK